MALAAMESLVPHTRKARWNYMYKSLIVIILMALSGCATKSVYFKSDRESATNKKRLRISAPALFGATKQDLVWIKDGATSGSEFGGMFIFALPFWLADIPLSVTADSFALFSPKTWENQKKKDSSFGILWPYVIYVNNSYISDFKSSQEFEEFFKHLQDNADIRIGGMAFDLWSHGFECDDPCLYSGPKTYKRHFKIENCIQEQRIHVLSSRYSKTEYEFFMENTCQ